MKRLALSIIGGVDIPFLLTITLGPLSTYTENDNIKALLSLPVRWPRYVYVYLYPFHPKPYLYSGDTASLVALIVCNIVFYACLTYFILVIWKYSKKPVHAEPPPPPRFDHDASA